MIYGFAWVPPGTAWDAELFRVDEPFLSFEILHEEGQFARLTIEVINTGVGLLSAGRDLWAWLSWDRNDGAGTPDPVPMFYGRLIGIQDGIAGRRATLNFIARPNDYYELREALAETLRVLPWFDPVWLADNVTDPDTVLETRTARWHIDRRTLAVTASDIVAGEDGLLDVTVHTYDGLDTAYTGSPLRRVRLTGAVEWNQRGSGDVDLTLELVNAFIAGGSPYPSPIVSTHTGDGFLGSWPEAGRNIGQGWSWSLTNSIAPATWMQEAAYVVQWVDRADAVVDEPPIGIENIPRDGITRPGSGLVEPIGGTVINRDPSAGIPPTRIVEFTQGYSTWQAAFLCSPFLVSFGVHYDADRERTETVSCTLEADVQALLVDPDEPEEEAIEVSSELIGEPIDYDGAVPIGDVRRNSYFKTTRGAQSFENLLLLGRARLIASARAINLKFTAPWAGLADVITCRHSINLTDPRLPGGEASGKVIVYSLRVDAQGGRRSADVTIGCTIGYGVDLAAPAGGTGVYAQPGYMQLGYQVMTGRYVAVIAGELQYQDFGEFEITDDDGIDLLDMRAGMVVNSLTVDNGPDLQREAIDTGRDQSIKPDPIGFLQNAPTVVTLNLKPVDGGAFRVDFVPEVSTLVVAQTINLEAA